MKKKENQTICIRCDSVMPPDQGYSVAELDYCECCHDDLFVSWKQAYEKTNREEVIKSEKMGI